MYTILQHDQASQKITRLAYQILENNADETCLILFGIKNRGLELAQRIAQELRKLTDIPIHVESIRMNKENPVFDEITTSIEVHELVDQAIVIVDDVANSGRTLMYALKPFMNKIFRKIQIAVLVDRQHKAFPVQADFVGLSLSTTLQEHIHVEFGNQIQVQLR